MTTHKPSAHWDKFGLVCLVMTTLAAAAYLTLQWTKFGSFSDPVFVGIMIANALTLYRFTRHVRSQLEMQPSEIVSHRGAIGILASQQEFLDQIFGGKPIIACGVLVGSVYAGAIFVISPWDNPNLNYLLGALLFGVNLLHGMAFYSLGMFWMLSNRRIQGAEISIFNISRPDIASYIDINRSIVIIAALITSLAITSLMFSKFEFDVAILAFSVFALLVVLATYVAPLYPLSAKLKSSKLAMLNQIESEMETQHHALHNPDIGGDMKEKLAILEALIAFHKSIRAVRTFPPGGQFSFTTAASVTFLTFLPSLLDYTLSKLQ